MLYGAYRIINEHPWTYPPHHFSDLLSLLWRIAVYRTVLTRCLLLSERTMVQTVASIISQQLIFHRNFGLLQLMAGIQLYHFTDSSFFPFYSAWHHKTFLNSFSFASISFFTSVSLTHPKIRKSLSLVLKTRQK